MYGSYSNVNENWKINIMKLYFIIFYDNIREKKYWRTVIQKFKLV